MRICPQCARRTEARICPEDGFQTVDEALLRQTKDPRVGLIFEDRYRIEGVLGRGGMGTVYRATQLSVGRPVAIKVLNAALVTDLTTIARFQQEARSVAALRHPNTIRLIDFGQSEGDTLFLVMEFLEGEPLSALIKREAPLDPERVIRFGMQALESLAEAHSVGIVHRDLKPDNLFVTELFGRPDFLKVLDFGIAKVSGFGADTKLTGDGVALGTPRYIAPEQASAERVDARADIYSLCALLYEMLSGKPPFIRGSVIEYMLAHIEEDVPPLKREGEELRGRLPDLIYAGLSKLPEHRPPNALAALECLRACAGTPFEEGISGLKRGADTTRTLPEFTRGRPTQSTERSLELRAVPELMADKVPLSEGSRGPHVSSDATEVSRAALPRASATGLSPRGGSSNGSPSGSAPLGVMLAALALLGLGLSGVWWAMQDMPVGSKALPKSAQVAGVKKATRTQAATAPINGLRAKQAALPQRGDARATDELQKPQDGVVMLKTIPAGATVKRGKVVLGVTPLALVWAGDEDRRGLQISLEGHHRERLRRSDVGEARSYELYLRPLSAASRASGRDKRAKRGQSTDGWMKPPSKRHTKPTTKEEETPPVPSGVSVKKVQVYEELD